MDVYEYEWFEVWINDGEPRHPLILLARRNEAVFDIYDPSEKSICHAVRSYEEAMHWLTEDDFTKVEGRMAI